MAKLTKLFQRNCVRRMETSDAAAAQCRQMATGAKARRQVAGERAHIGTLAAGDAEAGVVGVGDVEQGEAVDARPTRRQMHRLAGAGQVVGPPAADLDRRVARRNLLDVADETGDRRLDLGPVRASGGGVDHLALGVVRGPLLAPADGEVIGLGRRHDAANGLGRLAQCDRQHAACEGVEGAGVAELGGTGGAAHRLYGGEGAHAHRLVEVEPAMQRPPAASSTRHCRPRRRRRSRGPGPAPRRAGATGGRSRSRRRSSCRPETTPWA